MVINENQEIKDFRKSKEWRDKRLKLIEDKGGKCEFCGSKEFLTPAHKHRTYNIREMKYIDWYKNFDNCVLLCRKCHFTSAKGLILCKCCKKKYHHYNFSSCWDCKKEIKKSMEEGIKEMEEEEALMDECYDKKYNGEKRYFIVGEKIGVTGVPESLIKKFKERYGEDLEITKEK